MLIPLVDIPASATLIESSTDALLTFISHIGILGPVMLRVPNISDETEALALKLVESAANATACYIDGLTIDGDELATKLLDKGARAVFFKVSAEEKLQSMVMSSLPRARVGLNCTAEMTVTLAHMTELVKKYREYSGHFLFRFVPFIILFTLRS
jgi:hypothetical protein